jgi:hypothetical protein
VEDPVAHAAAANIAKQPGYRQEEEGTASHA